MGLLIIPFALFIFDSSVVVAQQLGTAEVSPRTVQVGSRSIIRIRYTVGRREIATGGGVRIFVPYISTYRIVPHRSPHTVTPRYVVVLARTREGMRRLRSVKGKSLGVPWWEGHWLEITNEGAPLRAGDSIEVLYCADEKEKPQEGVRIESVPEKDLEFTVEVDPTGSGKFVRLENSPVISVVAGAASRLFVVAPMTVAVGEEFALKIAVTDAFANPPISPFVGKVKISCNLPSDIPSECTFGEGDRNLCVVKSCRITKQGLAFITVSAESGGLVGCSNPIVVSTEPPRYRIYFGDIHVHTAFSDGKFPPREAYAYGRDVSLLDFCAITDHDGCLNEERWRGLVEAAREAYVPGKFVTFPGFEWSGNLHRTVYFPTDEHLPFEEIFAHLKRKVPGKPARETVYQERNFIPAMLRLWNSGYRFLMARHAQGRSDWNFRIPDFERIAEAYSIWGIHDKFILRTLERGFQAGIYASSDTHNGRPGRTLVIDRYGAEQLGLTAVYASELTRAGIFEALNSRRCYAASASRIFIAFEMDGHMMGESYRTDRPPEISVRVAGTRNLDRVELYRNNSLLFARKISSPTRIEEFKYACVEPPSPAGDFYFVKVVQKTPATWTSPNLWSKEQQKIKRRTRTEVDVAWSSPIFVSRKSVAELSAELKRSGSKPISLTVFNKGNTAARNFEVVCVALIPPRKEFSDRARERENNERALVVWRTGVNSTTPTLHLKWGNGHFTGTVKLKGVLRYEIKTVDFGPEDSYRDDGEGTIVWNGNTAPAGEDGLVITVLPDGRQPAIAEVLVGRTRKPHLVYVGETRTDEKRVILPLETYERRVVILRKAIDKLAAGSSRELTLPAESVPDMPADFYVVIDARNSVEERDEGDNLFILRSLSGKSAQPGVEKFFGSPG